MSSTKKRILIVEDEIIVGKDIESILTNAGYHITGIASTYTSALKFFKTNIPDLLLCDINLGPGKSGIEFVKESRKLKHVPVIYLTAHTDEEIVNDALGTSPDAYLTKPFTNEQLLVTVSRLLNFNQTEKLTSNGYPIPTRREIDIMHFIAKGESSKSIAKKLCISFETVRTHRKNLFNKYKVGSISELINLAHTKNWLS